MLNVFVSDFCNEQRQSDRQTDRQTYIKNGAVVLIVHYLERSVILRAGTWGRGFDGQRNLHGQSPQLEIPQEYKKHN